MLPLMIFSPLVIGAVLLLARSKPLNIAAIYGYSVLHLAASLVLYFHPAEMAPYFKVDHLNILFLLILSVLNFGVTLYHGDFLSQSGLTRKWHTYYAIFLLLFILSMTGVILATHLGLMWVFVEATTLASAPFIYYEGTKTALEATWKYVFICSVGIALAFVGIILLSIGAGGASLYFDDLYRQAAGFSTFWLRLAFPFILIGFGTKMGLAPVHAWLPDAHSESPSPISAMLSGALLNAAFLGILRVYKVMTLAGLGGQSRSLLIAMGFLSLFVCAVFIGKSRNYKRMLAYSSVENMGLVSLGIGLGGVGVYAAMLHLLAHSLAKASFFLTAGNIWHRFRTKEIIQVHGLLQTDKLTGWLWICCFLAISAMPPFPAFISEFLMVKALLDGGHIWLMVLFLSLVTVIMYSMGKAVLGMSFGSADHRQTVTGKEPTVNYLPQLLFLALLLLMGVSMPGLIQNLIRQAAENL